MCSICEHVSSRVCVFCPATEERARIYSSDSDEGSDEDKAQRLMKAKKLDSDDVSDDHRQDRSLCQLHHCVGFNHVRERRHLSVGLNPPPDDRLYSLP